MNIKNQTNCTSCNVYDQCFLICCPIANLCNQCVLDHNIFDEYYVCPNCDRPIGRMYRNMVDQAQVCIQEVNMRGNMGFNNYGNSNSKMARNNSFTSLNMNCNQIQSEEEEFQFIHNSRQQNQQQVNLKRNNFNQFTQSNNINMNNQQIRNNFTRQQGNTFNGGIDQQNSVGRNNGKVNLRDIVGNQGQQNMNKMNGNYNQRQNINNFNGKINNFNGQMNSFNGNFNNNAMVYNNNSWNNNYNNNYQQHSNNFNINQQFNQQQCQQTNTFTTNIRKIKQTQQQNQSEEFFFQDEIQQQQQQKFRSRGDTITGNNSGIKNNFNFTSNQTAGDSQFNNNPFNQQNNNFIQNNRTNKNINFNNFNQSNKKINGQNHTFDQQDQFFLTDQRMVKSATKLRRNDFSPNSFKRNNFKAIQNASFFNSNGLIDDKNRNSEKDLSPTFGQGDIKERQNIEFEARGAMIPEEKHETMNLKRSGSSYTLG